MLRWLVLTGFCLTAATLPAAELRFDFSQEPEGEIPPGFRSAVTGQGQPGEWRVVMDEVPPTLRPLTPNARILTKRAVLGQLARDPTDEHFPLLIYTNQVFGDFTLTTRFKTVSGKAEEMAGIAFRLKDEKNYYVVRASSLGNTFRFYRVVDGQRGQIIGPSVEIASGAWHDLTVTAEANQFRFLLDGKELIPPITDSTFASGQFAFWTKSDSVSYFGDTQVRYVPLVVPAQVLVSEVLRRYPRLLGLRIYATNSTSPELRIIASSDQTDVGKAGDKVERDVVSRDVIYCGRDHKQMIVTLPLHDRNGDAVAAVRVALRSFPGQTDDNAVARALPIVKRLEGRFRSAKDLVE
ncbi:MAG: hypothetical protein KGS61_15650 [Verrucomicrobia bacterium]|nr:hypothetical protein [Verrucomicrobiota bacterium]